ncbi:DNA polymerase IV [Marinicrinis sediminis]|uniref:DNA polymerase IV n=1 Tax=Marinicrinis sediminis TaxID=1652465 RepID=A0ABW5R6F3_9BACL
MHTRPSTSLELPKQTSSRVIFLVDMQSFYASVEKAAYPEYRNQPVVVAGDPARRSGIVLAACPIAKTYGITTAERLGEAMGKCPKLIVVRPHMQRYIEVSLQISEIMERFSDLVEPYSIDEQFMDVTGSQKLFGEPENIARQLQQMIQTETGVYARVGIGPNKVLAKMACDNFAKKNENGIHTLSQEQIADSLWKLPVGCMFGIGSRMRRHLQRLGIHSIGELARFPLHRLKQRWGINGEVIWLTANGIDYSPVSPDTHHQQQKAVGHQMTLPRDYDSLETIQVILLELSEEVCRRARSKGLIGQTVSVGCRGIDFERPTGFYRQMTLSDMTCHGKDVYQAACALFKQHWDGQPVRSVSVTLSQLQSDALYQMDLFRDREKERSLDQTLDWIKDKYGSAAIVRSVSATQAGQAWERAHKIGGHYK